ncbi:hypothetical protein BSLG_001140 [Batrachochytrium salamandrivorans]|nr:hypothetical protein BSLG_001140 [Batrachochytrium salamandrivorans]
MPQPNQLHVLRDDVKVSAADLIATGDIQGSITDHGVRNNINVALQYMEAWLRGNGCVPIHNLMEMLLLQISRSQTLCYDAIVTIKSKIKEFVGMSTSWELLLLGATGSNKRSDSLASSGQVCPVDAFNADDISSSKKEESAAGTSERWQQTRRYVWNLFVKELVASNQHGKAKDMLLNLVTKANLVAPIEQVVTSDAALPLENFGAATMIATTVLPLSTGELSTVESDFANIDGTTTMANMQVSMLRLTDSQDMYLQAASRTLMSFGFDEYTDKLQHPFLLYSRFMLRKYMKTCLVPESERDLVAQCAKIVELSLPGKVNWFQALWAHKNGLLSDTTTKGRIDVVLARKVEKMCSQACAHISRTDTTADTALAQMHSFGRFSESLNDLVGAAITKSSPILCRRIMARIFAKSCYRRK